MILAPAIHYKDTIYTKPKPARHMDVAILIFKEHPTFNYGMGVNGFLRDDGAFLDREAAGEHALQCGQVKELHMGNELYSEELY